MNFPIQIDVPISGHKTTYKRRVTLHKAYTVLLGPNGSGKTHLLRGLKNAFGSQAYGKHVRFLSAGRMGMLERFRSDYSGQYGTPRYEEANFGSKGEGSYRHRMESLNGDFQTLAHRSDILIKIQERLRKLFKRDVIIDWDGGNLKISFSRIDTDLAPYSAGREASGLMHLVGILAALYDDEVGVLLLDEPEVSLHPQLQAFLLKEILNAAGDPSENSYKKIIVVATHSTEMLQIQNAEDLLSLIFCYDLMSPPVQIDAQSAEWDNRKLQGLIARLGQEHKLSLFSIRPLLVEGPSDVIVCSAIANLLELHLEAAGSQLLPVIGKDQMPIVLKLLRLLGKAPVVLSDADGIADGVDLANSFLFNSVEANTRASSLGFASAQQMTKNIYNDFCKLVEERWEEISASATSHPYWINRASQDLTLSKRRAAFCTLFLVDPAILASIAQDNAWLTMRSRIAALLDLLEQCGLFFLRKGTIESYYQSVKELETIGKPTAAVSEIEHINTLKQDSIKIYYSDIVRCLNFASNTEKISEADALRDQLLAVAAPAHARLKNSDPSLDFNLLARSILGERSKIFNLKVEQEKLIIHLESKILNVKGFPMVLGKEDDIIRVINSTLKSIE